MKQDYLLRCWVMPTKLQSKNLLSDDRLTAHLTSSSRQSRWIPCLHQCRFRSPCSQDVPITLVLPPLVYMSTRQPYVMRIPLWKTSRICFAHVLCITFPQLFSSHHCVHISLTEAKNALGSSHAPICDTSVPSCTGSKISMEYDPEVTGMCLLDTSGSPAADPDTSAIPSCASTQPSDFSGITVDGEFTFSNYALIAPKQASTSNPLLLSFSSPGLIGASFGLELRPGVAVKLGLVLP